MTINCPDYSNGSTSELEYFWGKDLSGTFQGAGGVGGLLAVRINSAYFFPFYDHNGNITDYVDANGTLVAHYEYDAFGNTIVKTGNMADVFRHRFSTKYYDIETGLYNFGLRDYSPILRRWLNRDPLEEQGGLNLYAFCKNDPINYIDLLGLIEINLISRNKPQDRLNMSKVKSKNGVYVVGGHGSSSSNNQLHGKLLDSNNKILDPAKLAKVILNDRYRYTPGQTVWVVACNIGAGKPSYADELAIQLGKQSGVQTTVTASPGIISVDSDGVVKTRRGWFDHTYTPPAETPR